jgi:hypothetical protein
MGIACKTGVLKPMEKKVSKPLDKAEKKLV